jgi:threonine dehydrogenase-like Zn-dependent dehydrogenase
LHHIAEGKIDSGPLITGHVSLDGVKGAFAELANPERHAKIMVDPWR